MKLRSTKARAFPDIELSDSEREYYNGVGDAIFKRAVAEYSRCNGCIDARNWGYVRSRKQISMYRSLEERDDPRKTVMIGSGFIPGVLEDVIDGIYCDTTEDLCRVKTLLGYKLVDGAVLNVSEYRDPSDPFRFEGIKWFAAKAPWGVTSTRDLLTYEQMGSIVDKSGAEVVYHVVQSINRSEWPANTIKSMKREETSTCYLYRQDLHGLVRCFLWGEIYDLNPLTQRVAEFVIAGIWLNMTRSVKCAHAKRCSLLIAASKNRSSAATSECSMCSRQVGIFGSSHIECAGCCEIVCKSCSIQRPIFSINKRSKKPEERRFCKPCLSTAYAYPQSFSHTGIKRDRWDAAPFAAESAIPVKSPQRGRWKSAAEASIPEESPLRERWGSAPEAAITEESLARERWGSEPPMVAYPPSMRGKMSLSDLMQRRMSISELLPTNRGAGVYNKNTPFSIDSADKHSQSSTVSSSFGSDSSNSDSATDAAEARRKAGFDKLKDLPEARQTEEMSDFDLSALLDAETSTRDGRSNIPDRRKAGFAKLEELPETLRTDELSEFDLNLLLEADISTRGGRSKRQTRRKAGFDKLGQLPEMMQTDQLSEFELSLLLQGGTTTRDGNGKGNRVHHELVFASAREHLGTEKKMFLDDLYSTLSPTSRRNIRSFPV